MTMAGSISLTRRLTVTVLVLELLSALALIGAITVHERHVQLKAFDASLVATAESLMGAVQDTGDKDDNVMLDLREIQIPKDAGFSVQDERGRILGRLGPVPNLEKSSSGAPVFHNIDIAGRGYRFIVLQALRIVDAGDPGGGVRHRITIIYGIPDDHIWHEVLDAIRFFAVATAVLLVITAVLMVWLVRSGLSPVHELAREAERITASNWNFEAPDSAKRTVELQPLASALEAALACMQRSLDQQRRFTNDAAHELKTDAAIVKSSLQLLSMRKRTVDEYSQGLALCLDDFTRLEMTVQKMLTLARLEQSLQFGNSANLQQSCSLREAIEDAVNHSRSLAELKSIKVEVGASDDIRVPIECHDALLLCSNILLNAIQHSPNGATIRIAMSFGGGIAQLKIEDQGEGISEEERALVFEPFYRGDPSRSRKTGGTGLGLSICKAICERANGSIDITNNPTGGAKVTVSLPAECLSADSSPVFSVS